MRRIAIVLVLLALAALPAAASSSLLGPTGLLLIPTADALAATQWNVGGSSFSADEEDVTAVYANMGLWKGLEVGASWFNGDDADSELLLNAKVRLPQPVPVKLSLAAGVMDITDAIDATPYLVASHMIGGGLVMRQGFCTAPQVHLGVGGGMLDGLFGGVSAVVAEKISVMAEYDGSDVNLGAKLPLAANVELTGSRAGRAGRLRSRGVPIQPLVGRGN